MGKFLGALILAVLTFFLTALIVMVAWDNVGVNVLHLPEISFGQALWMRIFTSSLFNFRELKIEGKD